MSEGYSNCHSSAPPAILLLTRKRWRKVVPDLGLPTITNGFVNFLLKREGQNKLSRAIPMPTINRNIPIRIPEIIGLIHEPKVLPRVI